MSGQKVLIVDDQSGIRALLTEVLGSEGYKTYQASNGRQALEIVKAWIPDMVLLDMKIPGMDGLEILRRIRDISKDSGAEVKVIMMTAYGELDIMKEAAKLGVLAHFTKPFDIDELCAEINHQLSVMPSLATGT